MFYVLIFVPGVLLEYLTIRMESVEISALETAGRWTYRNFTPGDSAAHVLLDF